ncbi:GNAT family protein [Arthrobacter sp. ATA002]|uniref:GNAT family N-acetyltransferase n=1 Tax=Arthrobacter sp. ATA002 TaxID=2991715 RepID=UPI0022A65DED|nr:GNAT family protein [Arthrobacter sp. ATA002]WAP53134.1 GNAT family protein [Arthrobacter sp. ATA002]
MRQNRCLELHTPRLLLGSYRPEDLAAAVVHFGFAVLGLDRIRATCRPGNAASSRVLEKTGMVLEARLPAHKLIRGRWEDSLLYAISPS